jgi:hypothetical protein
MVDRQATLAPARERSAERVSSIQTLPRTASPLCDECGTTPTRRRSLVSREILAFAAIALMARLVACFWMDAPGMLPAAAYEHGTIARSIVEGRGFSFHFYGPPGQVVPTSQQAPLMAGLLAGAYALLGTETRAAFWLVLVIQSVVGSWATWHLMRVTEAMFSTRRITWLAGMMASLGPAFVVAPTMVQAVTWNMLALAMMADGWWIVRRSPSSLGGITLVAIGNILAWHVDPIMAIAGALLIIASACGSWKRSSVAIVSPLILVGILPWTMRNIDMHGRFMLVKDSFAYVFWQGNTLASHGTDKLPSPTERLSVDTTMPLAFREHLASLPTEVQRMDAFGPLIVEEFSRRPAQYVEKSLLRARQWIFFDETNPKSRSLLYRVSYIGLILLAGVGAWHRRLLWREDLPLLIPIIVMTLFSVLVITSARFRLPAEFLLVPFAASGAGWLTDGMRRRKILT